MLRQAIIRPLACAVPRATTTPAAARAFSSVSRGAGGKATQAVAARSTPVTGGGGLSRVFDDMFADPFFASDPFFRPFLTGARGAFGGEAAVSPMGLDISETQTHFVVKAELPGIKKEDVRIELQEGVLTIEAERKAEASGEDKEHKLHYSDFIYGKVSRSLRLPDAADPNDVTAEMQDGVLKVAVKRAEHAQPKQIEIK